MKITQIPKINGTGVFQRFDWSNLQPIQEKTFDFQSVNLIFGWNGTGKTTLSRMFRNFELGRVCEKLKKYPNSEYEICCEDGTQLSQLDVGNKKEVRVFNKDFVNENIFQDFEQDGSSVRPIFYLGGERIELAKERKERDGKAELLGKVTHDLQTQTKAKDKFATDAAKTIKDLLLGVKEFQHYHKDRLIKAWSSINEKIARSQISVPSDLRLEADLFSRKLRTVKSSEALETWVTDIKRGTGEIASAFFDEFDSLLGARVSLQTIMDELKDDWKLSEWVREGLTIHVERKSVHCEFCAQTLPARRIEALQAYFNREYLDLSSAVDRKIEKLSSLRIEKSEAIPNDDLKALAEKFNGVLDGLLVHLKKKQKNILQSNPMPPTEKSAAIEAVSGVATSIEGFQASMQLQANELEQALVAEKFDEYTSLSTEVTKTEELIARLGGEISALDEKIGASEKAVRDFKLPAQRINTDLLGFLGHSELKFEDGTDEHDEPYYRIERGGEAAFNLSEGEKTAISLIYFLRKLQEDDFDLKTGVVFIDDPISSLDSQFLYSAYALIIASIEDGSSGDLQVGQFFLSTHNYDFFNLFKRKFRRKIDKGTCGAYMLRLTAVVGTARVSNIYKLDPLLIKFDTDYQYLFSKLIEFEKASDAKKGELENIYPYPNIARRVLETFLSFKYPSKTDYRAKVDAAQNGSKELREAVYQFTNRHSHGTMQEAEGFSPQILEPTAAQRVLDVLSLMRSEDSGHCAEIQKSF